MSTKQVHKLNGEDEVVQRLRRVPEDVDQLALPTGRRGTAFLDALEVVEKIRARMRDKAKELLLTEPEAIPDYFVIKGYPMRELSKDVSAVFRTLHKADESITGREFMTACTTTLSAIRKLISEQHPDWDTERLERFLTHSLSPVVSYRKCSAKLMRRKQ
jgi:hypothetical protein